MAVVAEDDVVEEGDADEGTSGGDALGDALVLPYAPHQGEIRAGGINGRPVNIVFADDKGQVASVKSAFDQLIAAKPVMLVGGYASDPTYQMAKLAQKKDVPFLICTASADKITQKGWKNIYRLNPPISEYTKGLEDFLVNNFKPQSMAIIYENSKHRYPECSLCGFGFWKR